MRAPPAVAGEHATAVTILIRLPGLSIAGLKGSDSLSMKR
jgi:hypothetical protein